MKWDFLVFDTIPNSKDIKALQLCSQSYHIFLYFQFLEYGKSEKREELGDGLTLENNAEIRSKNNHISWKERKNVKGKRRYYHKFGSEFLNVYPCMEKGSVLLKIIILWSKPYNDERNLKWTLAVQLGWLVDRVDGKQVSLFSSILKHSGQRLNTWKTGWKWKFFVFQSFPDPAKCNYEILG